MRKLLRLLAVMLCLMAPAGMSYARGISRADALRIAKKAIASHEEWTKATYTLHRDHADWSVLVWRIVGYSSSGKPQFTPGGFRVITINKRGKVVRYYRGY